ncbi:MAG: four helix bundle protein [Myxococcales bacterium]|nr:four helix bundle protein [Myxococcales bacterium]
MRVIDSLVELVRIVHGLAAKIARQDPDLARQLRRASTSAALNTSEGLWAKAGKRRSRLEDAVNSAREVRMGLRLARACGYLAPHDTDPAVNALDNIIPVLWTLAHRR